VDNWLKMIGSLTIISGILIIIISLPLLAVLGYPVLLETWQETLSTYRFLILLFSIGIACFVVLGFVKAIRHGKRQKPL
jgi:hypothetical protein